MGESSIGTRLGKSFKLRMFICSPSKRTILISVCGRYQIGRQDRKQRTDMENVFGRRWLGRTNIISWPCVFGLHSKRVSNPRFAAKILWVWKDIANLQIKRLNNYTKSQHHALTTTNLKKKSQLEKQFVHKLFWNVWIWLVFDDLIFCGNLLVSSRNGREHATHVSHVWSLTFIIQVNTGIIVIRQTQHNIADQDFSPTLILQDTLKTRNEHQEEFDAFSEVTRLCQ